MLEALPYWLHIFFIITVLITLGLFFWAHRISRTVIITICLWTIIQSVLAFSLFYRDVNAFPPRFLLVLLPSFLFLGLGLTSKPLSKQLKRKNLNKSTLVHSVRIPVELTLYYLFIYSQVPELMTFSGRNFDIIAGVTTPLAAWCFRKGIVGLRGMLYWNTIALALVLFILVNGVLSSELPFQLFALDQPNVAITYFPYVLLPGLIVPIVVYTHITDIIYIRRKLKGTL